MPDVDVNVDVNVNDRGLNSADKKLEGLSRSADKANKRAGILGGGISKLSSKLGGGHPAALAGAAALAGVAVGVKLFSSLAKTGDQFDKMSKRLGISVETLSKWKFAAEQSGASIESIEKGMLAFGRQLENAKDGLSTSVDAFDKLGPVI